MDIVEIPAISYPANSLVALVGRFALTCSLMNGMVTVADVGGEIWETIGFGTLSGGYEVVCNGGKSVTDVGEGQNDGGDGWCGGRADLVGEVVGCCSLSGGMTWRDVGFGVKVVANLAETSLLG
eukprot:9757727-Ditylum_brightwellii.AAC.1